MNNSEKEIARSLTKIPDSYGHSYQYSITRKIAALSRDGKTIWQLFGAEIPTQFVKSRKFVCGNF